MRVEEIRRLIKLVEESQINELEVRRWWTRVRILKRSENHHGENSHAFVVSSTAPVISSPAPARSGTATPPPPAATTVETQREAPPAEESGLILVKSPMVGTFYRAPSATSPPYIEVNQRVQVGQVVCIVEAMKLMNEIESEVAGTVVRILVENGQPVEFNQALFLVQPD